MKQTVLLSALALSLSFGGAFAQQAQDPQQAAPAPQGEYHHAPNPHRQAEHLSKELNLTPDQTAKIEPILASRDQQMQALRQNSQLSEADRHQQMRSINQQSEQQMNGILTPDQVAQLKAMRHHGHRGPQDGGEPNQAPTA